MHCVYYLRHEEILDANNASLSPKEFRIVGSNTTFDETLKASIGSLLWTFDFGKKVRKRQSSLDIQIRTL